MLAALVTNQLAYNDVYASNGTELENPKKELLTHSITFVELDDNDNVQGSYEYDVPYCMNVLEVNATDSSIKTYDYSSVNYPSTSACKHYVVNKSTTKIMIVANMCAPLNITSVEGNAVRSYILRALLVEKNK